MKKINKSIEIVRSSIGELSSMGPTSSSGALAILRQHYKSVHITTVNSVDDLQAIVDRRPDLVFLGMKYVPDPSDKIDGKTWLSDFLDEHDILYTGSDQLAHNLELNKDLAKQRMVQSGVATAPYYVVSDSADMLQYDSSLVFPLFVKPSNLGGGQGIDEGSVIHDNFSLMKKVAATTKSTKSYALVEEYLSGREFSVAVLKKPDGSGYSIMPIELVAPANKLGERVLTAQIKGADTEKFLPVLDKKLYKKLCDVAEKAFHSLGSRDYGRIDIRLDKFGEPNFLEANLIPSLLDNYGNFPKACMLNINLPYEHMMLAIVNLAFDRQQTAPAASY